MRLLFSILLIMLFPGILISQESSTFTTDTEKFLKEVEDYLGKSDRIRTNELIKELSGTWESGGYSNSLKVEIIEISNAIVAAKYRNFPDLSNFLYSIAHFTESEIPMGKIETWFDIIKPMISDRKKKKEVRKLLAFSADFFDNWTLYKTTTGSVNWKLDPVEFEFKQSGKILIDFKKTRLVCTSKDEFISIQNTVGSFDPIENLWQGNNGKVSWSRSGKIDSEVYVELSKYTIDVTKPSYQADSVNFYNKDYFSRPLLGRLEDKVASISNPDNVRYPKFSSYQTTVVLSDIIKGVNYRGGFAQHGAQIIGQGTAREPAIIEIKRENRPFFEARASQFLFKINDVPEDEQERRWWQRKQNTSQQTRNRIVSSNARVVIKLEGDSLVHPGLKFTLYTDDRAVSLIRIKGDLSETPYTDSYHKIEMRFELLNWSIDDPLMEFGSYKWSSDKDATFESFDYFKEFKFDKLMGISDWHPLSEIKRCAKQLNTNVLTSMDIARCLRMPPTSVEPMLLELSVQGYLSFDEESKVCILLPKLEHQVLSKSEMKDYDVLSIESVADASTSFQNATLNLLNNELTIKGVDRIILSDSHNVQIFPGDRTIKMRKNRDFDFNGLISSGKVEFFGTDFQFLYDEFKIYMPTIDSIQLWASTDRVDDQGYKLEARVQTVIEKVEGELEIDHPMNKSGVSQRPEFPIFSSFAESYAFYDKKEIHEGVYDRDKFFFELDPFIVDSLDKFTNQGIRFFGTFYSAGIFPQIEEVLRLQEDYSLGFKRETPPDGYPAYGGLGNFRNEIQLSNDGLKGDGTLTYLTSTAESEAFYFFPQQVRGITKLFNIDEQLSTVEYPNVTADTVDLNWQPYRDLLQAKTIKGRSPINMFTGVSKHEGQLDYTPRGLWGSGKNSFEGANLYSDSMSFSFFKILADTADFELGTDLLDALDFSSTNVNAEIDFNERIGDFLSNEGASLTVFEQCQYQAYLDRFTWYMDAESVEFSADGQVVQQGGDELQIEGAEFISINPKQDSLSFYAKAATYNLRETKITAKEVEFINVADAEIRPSDGLVLIYKAAKMDPLEMASIIANRELRYHRIYDAHVEITSKWKYDAYGKYEYKDENGLIQPIEFNTVTVDTSRQTFAEGILTTDNDFTLSPMYRFKGDVRMLANRRNLNFDGFGQLNHDCKDISLEWFGFSSEVDPNDIVITIEPGLINDNGDELLTGVVLPSDSSDLYGAFLSKSKSKKDYTVNPPTGYLDFDAATREYRISNLEKLAERSFPGNYVALNTQTCELDGEGQLALTEDMGFVDVKPVGRYTYNPIEGKLEVNAVVAVNFLIDEGAMAMMLSDIYDSDGAEANTERQVYEVGLRELLGKEEADEMISRMSLGKTVKIPDELKATFFFADLNFRWDSDEKGFLSEGQLGIGNIDKNTVNISVTGGLDLLRKRRGTDLRMFVEPSPSKWYVFDYRASTGYMKVYSSNKEFNTTIIDLKGDKKKIKPEKGQKPYIYTVMSSTIAKRIRNGFLDREE
jgi:hypothetical protein